MRVTFVLPVFARTPVGGVKVVYHYANRLVRRGHGVAIVHSLRRRGRSAFLSRLRGLWIRMVDRSRPPWFELDPGVGMSLASDPDPMRLPPGDVVVATAWQTAPWVAAAPPSAGRGLYLIQGYETWRGHRKEVEDTWRLPLHKVVVSRHLREIAVELGEEARTTYIPNGVELDTFRVTTPLEERPQRVGMLFSPEPWKGSADGIEAIRRARAARPGLAAVFFGTARRPTPLPGWIDYVRRPDPEELAELYNGCSVFLQPSWTEGWGLTATEAMACGCALVTTDNGGSRDYAFHEETALVTPPREPSALAGALERVLTDGGLRRRLGRAGSEHVGHYTWERATDRLEELMRSLIAGSAPGSARS